MSSGDPLDDAVRQIQAGVDVERNFEILHRHFHPRLFYYFSSRGLERGLCEDLTQEVFVRVFNNIGSFEHRSRFSTWLYEIVENLFRNELRRARTAKRSAFEKPLEEEVDPDGEDWAHAAQPLVAKEPGPYEDAELHDQVSALREALGTLPPQMRRCLLLRLYHGRKYREVAEILGISIDAVKAHLGQAKVRLRQLLGDPGGILARLTEEADGDRGGEARRSGRE